MATVKIGVVADPHVEYRVGNLALLADAQVYCVAQGADIVVGLGDMVSQDATKFDDVADAMNGDGTVPYAIALGNHDCIGAGCTRAAFLAAIATEGGSDQTSFNQTIQVAEGVRLIILDTNWQIKPDGVSYQHRDQATPNPANLDPTSMFVHPDDVAWLQTQLDAAVADDQWVVVATHASLFTLYAVGVETLLGSGINNWEQIRIMLQACPKVLACVNGHNHNNLLRSYDPHSDGRPIQFIALPDIGYGATTRARAGVLVIDTDTGRLSMLSNAVDNVPVTPWSTCVWAGGTSTAWLTAANWEDGAIPTSGDIIWLPSTAARDCAVTAYLGIGLTQLWLQSGFTHSFIADRVSDSAGFQVAGVISFAAGTTLSVPTAGRSFVADQYWGAGTISGAGDLRIMLPSGRRNFWTHTGTFSLTGSIAIHEIEHSYAGGPTATNDADCNWGAAPIITYHSSYAVTYHAKFKFLGQVACGTVTIASGDGITYTGEFTSLDCDGITIGSAATSGVGKITLGAGLHVVAGPITAVGAVTTHELNLGGRTRLAGSFTGTGIVVTVSGDGRIDCGGTGRVTAVTATGRRLVVHRAVDSGGDPVRSWNGDGCTNVRFLGRRVIGDRFRPVA